MPRPRPAGSRSALIRPNPDVSTIHDGSPGPTDTVGTGYPDEVIVNESGAPATKFTMDEVQMSGGTT